MRCDKQIIVIIGTFLLGILLLLLPGNATDAAYTLNLPGLRRRIPEDFIECASSDCNIESSSYVLNLGAGGMVGRGLTNRLLMEGYNVAVVKGRTHLDLREPYALDIFKDMRIMFAFFLACEVGGSKYLTGARTTAELFVSNSHLHAAVLPWLEERNIKFVYVGSQLMESQPNSPYGLMKAHGRDHCRAYAHLCRLIVFWNVYGMEPLGLRSHFVPDWLDHCLLHNQSVTALTDGTESRQMVHVDDVARGLILLMNKFDQSPLRLDFTHGEWSELRDLKPAFASAPQPCNVHFTDKKAAFSVIMEPNVDTNFHKEWLAAPLVTMRKGIDDLQAGLIEMHRRADAAWNDVYISFVMTAPTDGTAPGDSIPAHVARLCLLHLVPAEFIIIGDNPEFATKLNLLLDKFNFVTVPTGSSHDTAIASARGIFVALAAPGMYITDDIIFQIAKKYLREDAMYYALEMDVDVKASGYPVASPEAYGPTLVAKRQRPYFYRSKDEEVSFHCSVFGEEKLVVAPRAALGKKCQELRLDIITFDGPVHRVPPYGTPLAPAATAAPAAMPRTVANTIQYVDFPATTQLNLPYLRALVPPDICTELAVENNRDDKNETRFCQIEGSYGSFNNHMRFLTAALQSCRALRGTLVIPDYLWRELNALMDIGWLLRFYDIMLDKAFAKVKMMSTDIAIYTWLAGGLFWKPSSYMDMPTDAKTQAAVAQLMKAYSSDAPQAFCGYAAVIPAQQLRVAAGVAVSAVGGPGNFMGVHMRMAHFEWRPNSNGYCNRFLKGAIRKQANIDPAYSNEHCSGTNLSFVKAMGDKLGAPRVFLASDRMNKTVHGRWMKDPRVSQLDLGTKHVKDLGDIKIPDTLCKTMGERKGCHWSAEQFMKSNNATTQLKRASDQFALIEGLSFSILVDMWVLTQARVFFPFFSSTVGMTVCAWLRAFFPQNQVYPSKCSYLFGG